MGAAARRPGSDCHLESQSSLKTMKRNPTPDSDPGVGGRVRRAGGFSLLELLVAVGILAMMMVMVLQMVSTTQKTWSDARSRVAQFREAQVAFEVLTRRVSQATLNTYIGYDKDISDPNRPQDVRDYVRESELHFLSGEAEDITRNNSGRPRPTHAIFFQAPFGFTLRSRDQAGVSIRDDLSPLSNLLNAWGYYIEYGTDENFRPDFLESLPSVPQPRYRFRLMEFRPPTENNLIYAPVPGGTTRDTAGEPKLWNLSNTDRNAYRFWFAGRGVSSVNSTANASGSSNTFRPSRVIAENIIALIIRPRAGGERENEVSTSDSDIVLKSNSYEYDTREWQWRSGGNHQWSGDKIALNTKNMLPPLLDITMVAVDESSAERYQLLNGEQVPRWTEGLFSNPGRYEQDLDALERRLEEDNMKFRVFRGFVHIRESRWSDTFRS